MPLLRANDTKSLTWERLKEAFTYDPETGVFTSLIPGGAKGGGGRRIVGQTAGSLKPSGYVCINLDNVRYRAHRLAWFYMTGEPPDAQVDHINGDRADNRWANLRLANQQQNSANMRVRDSNRIGIKGVSVYYGINGTKYRGHIMIDGRTIYLGSFDTVGEAKAAYDAAAREAFGEFARAA